MLIEYSILYKGVLGEGEKGRGENNQGLGNLWRRLLFLLSKFVLFTLISLLFAMFILLFVENYWLMLGGRGWTYCFRFSSF